MPPPTPKKLQETLQRAAGGDEEAWREIVEAYTPRVFGLIRAHSGNVDLAQEVTQSAFCSIAQHIGRYTEVGRFESWLFRIAMNRLRDEMRRRRRQANPVDPQDLSGIQARAPAAVPAEVVEDVRALESALARLSPADRQVIHLRHFAGLSFDGMARVLDEPLGTVLARHHRALKKLRQFLCEEPGAGEGGTKGGGKVEGGKAEPGGQAEAGRPRGRAGKRRQPGNERSPRSLDRADDGPPRP